MEDRTLCFLLFFSIAIKHVCFFEMQIPWHEWCRIINSYFSLVYTTNTIGCCSYFSISTTVWHFKQQRRLFPFVGFLPFIFPKSKGYVHLLLFSINCFSVFFYYLVWCCKSNQIWFFFLFVFRFQIINNRETDRSRVWGSWLSRMNNPWGTQLR